MKTSLRHYALLLAKLLVTAGLIALLLRNADLAQVSDRLAKADPRFFAAAVLAMTGLFAVMALRWWMLSRALGVRVPGGRALLLYFEAVTFNLVLPGSVGGEVLRVWRTTRLVGRLRRNIAAVLFERFGNIGFLLLLVAGWAALELTEDEATRLSGLAAIALVVLAATSLLRWALRLGARWRRLRAVREIWRFGWLIRRRFFRPRTLLLFLALSLSVYGMASLAAAASLQATGTGGLGPLQIVAVTLVTMAGTAIPLSIAGTGFREGAMVLALGFYGVPSDAALASAFLFSAALFLQAIPGMAIWLSGSNGRAVHARGTGDVPRRT